MTIKEQYASQNLSKKVAQIAIFAALALGFSFLPSFPMLPSVGFIKYEFSDLPIIISTFAFGVPGGLIVAVVSILLNFLLGGAESGIYGVIMHVIAIGTYLTTSGLIYRFDKTRRGAVISLAAGTLAMTLIMVPANLIITPLFMAVPVDVVKGLLWPAIVPVNLMKGALTAVVTFILYKHVSRLLHR